MAKKPKKRYADGGNVPVASSSPTSAFTQAQVQPTPPSMFSAPNFGGTDNTNGAGGPLVTINAGAGPQPSFRKGGKVKSGKGASRGDGIAKKGKTRGRFV